MPCDITKTSSEIEHVDWSTGTGSGHHYTNVRFGSGSSQASQSSGDICRICHCESDPQNPLLTPCYCAGSLKYVHQTCLQQWLTASETNSCELCKFPFIMHTKIKPFNEWRSLDISGIERRRLCCSVLFHIAAALCVIWSLCVLIERAAEDVKNGAIDWPFWTKLAVVTVGLTGGIVFMYIQCKQYLHLCHRWKARNRILLIQNAPEKIHPLSPPSPAGRHRSSHVTTINEPHTSASAAACLAGGTASAGCNATLSNVEIADNGAAATANPYNSYATHIGSGGSSNPGCIGIGGGGIVANQTLIVSGDGGNVGGLHQHHHHHHHHHHQQHYHHHNAQHPSHLMASSPHHMLQQTDLDMQSLNARSFNAEHGGGQQGGQHLTTQHHHHHQLGQVAVAANIECSQSQNNYERDWALDDVVSQISSFRACPQGSGSMTPFHDSIHNVLEHSEDSSRVSTNDLCIGSRQDLSTGGISTDTGREHALQLSSFSGSGDHKAPSISSGVSHAVANGLGGFVYKPHTKRYSNSSIFLENRDILNDSVGLGLETTYDYPKIDYRHSSILTPPDAGDAMDDGDEDGGAGKQYFGRDLRRHSDTKLLGSVDADVHDPMLFSPPPDDMATHVITDAHTATDATGVAIGSGIMTAAKGIPKNENSTSKRIRQLLKQRSATEVDTVHDIDELPSTPLSPPEAFVVGPKQQRIQLHSSNTSHKQQQQQPIRLQLGGGGGGGDYARAPSNRHRKMLGRSFDLVDTDGYTSEHLQASQQEDDANSIDTAFVEHGNVQQDQHQSYVAVASVAQQQQQQIERGRVFFKSLPNLSRSRESLLKK